MNSQQQQASFDSTNGENLIKDFIPSL